MSTSRRPKKIARGKSRAPKKSQPSIPRLLLLQLDTHRLRADRLSLEDVMSGVRSWLPSVDVEVVAATTHRDLLAQLGALASRTFDVVVVIAHSNDREVRIASDQTAAWSVFAKYLQPFAPRTIALVACRAGRKSAGRALFEELVSLEQIFASPVNVRMGQAMTMVALAPLLLAVAQPPDRFLHPLRMGMAIADGGQLRRWLRDDDDDATADLLDGVADLLDEPLRRLSARAQRRG